jgi:Zn-dependent protease with chaperone function
MRSVVLSIIMSVAEHVIDPLLKHCTQLNQKTGGGVIKAVEELSRKAGLPTPRLYKLPANAGLTLDHFPAGACSHKDGPLILLGDNINKKLFGVDYSNYATISAEFKSILAHELGHIKRNDTKFPTGAVWRSNLSPFVYMVGALAGTYALRSYLAKKKDSEISHTPDEVAGELHKSLELPKEHKGTVIETVGKIGLYTAMALLGFSVGMVRLRSIRQSMEFACDAFSKELIGSGKPLASALSKLEEHTTKLYEEIYSHLPKQEREKTIKASETISSFLHPPTAKRVEALLR